ncbi:MAG: TolC family protein, partial [Armatimonadetes bacterium]|nr:TolC family protein [Armatimonadota bacterium]
QHPAPVIPQGVDLSKPLTLEDVVKIALANSPTIPIATEEVRRAVASATQARAAQLPNLRLGWTGQTSKSLGRAGGPGADAHQTQRTAQVVLEQTFFESGLKEDIRAARASAEASRHALADTHRLLVLEVAQRFYTALAGQEFVSVADRAVASAQQHLARVQARIEEGTAAPADRYPFEVELAQAQVQRLQAQTQAQQALDDLKVAMGLPAETPIALAGALTKPPLPTELSNLVRAAYASRPDVLEQQAYIEAARQTLRAAQLRRGPVISAGGSIGYGRYTDVTDEAWALELGVSLPLFDGQLTRARVEAARASLAIAEENLRRIRLNISAEVERNYLTAAQAVGRIDAAEAAVRAARISLEAAEAKYALGAGTVIEVTDAEVKLRQAEADRVQAYYDYNTALAALLAALGQPVVATGE